jgi:hypothetical protein
VCKGFLLQHLPDDIFRCKKCGTELITLPDHDEDSGEELEWGRICPISKPNRSSEQLTKEEMQK